MRSLVSLVLVGASLLCGYGYFRLSHGDLLSAIAFAFGLSGITLSILRQSKTKGGP